MRNKLEDGCSIGTVGKVDFIRRLCIRSGFIIAFSLIISTGNDILLSINTCKRKKNSAMLLTVGQQER